MANKLTESLAYVRHFATIHGNMELHRAVTTIQCEVEALRKLLDRSVESEGIDLDLIVAGLEESFDLCDIIERQRDLLAKYADVFQKRYPEERDGLERLIERTEDEAWDAARERLSLSALGHYRKVGESQKYETIGDWRRERKTKKEANDTD
jgi:hypothetical protein